MNNKLIEFSMARIIAMALGILSMISSMPALAKRMATSNTVTYKSDTADERFKTVLIVGPNGSATLKIGSNKNIEGEPVGVFQTTLPKSYSLQLLKNTTSSEFRQSPSQNKLIPGEAFKEIKVERPNNTVLIKRVGEQLPKSEAFSVAEITLEKIVDYVKKYPKLGAMMKIRAFPQIIESGQGGEFDAAISNVGNSILFLDAPTELGEASSEWQLVAVRADIPADQLTSAHQKFASLNSAGIEFGKFQSNTPLVQIKPNQSIAFGFKHIFDWGPGKYKVNIYFRLSLYDASMKQILLAELVSEPVYLSIP